MQAFTRNTTQGMQVNVFDSFAVREDLKGRGYRFGDLPRPVKNQTGWQYGPVEKGWYKFPVDEGEIQFLQSLGAQVHHITLDKNGAIKSEDN